MESLSNFQINSPEGYMLKNQNSLSNKSNSFILQISSDLPTLVTFDTNLKSFVHSFITITKAQ